MRMPSELLMLMQTLVRPMGPLRLASFSLLVCAAAASPSSNSMDVGAGAFSPDGSLFQLQYATRAAERGGLAVGVEAQGAVVLTCERRRAVASGGEGAEEAAASLLVRGSETNRKIARLSPSLGCSAAGILPDSRVLVDCGRRIVQQHWFMYGEAPSVEFVAAEMGEVALSFSNHPRLGEGEEPVVRMARPFGASLLIAGVDVASAEGGGSTAGGGGGGGGGGEWEAVDVQGSSSSSAVATAGTVVPSGTLYHLAPTGAYTRWRGKAIGAGSSAAELELAKAFAARDRRHGGAGGKGGGGWGGGSGAVLPVRDAVGIAVRALAKGLAAGREEEEEGEEGEEEEEQGGLLTKSGALETAEGAAKDVEVAIVRPESEGGFWLLKEEEVKELLEGASG